MITVEIHDTKHDIHDNSEFDLYIGAGLKDGIICTQIGGHLKDSSKLLAMITNLTNDIVKTLNEEAENEGE